MAIVSVDEVWDGRSGGVDEDGVHTVSRSFQVVTDSGLDDHAIAISAVGIFPGDPHPNLTVPALARSFEADHSEDDPTFWLVRVDYRSITEDDIPQPNPIQDPPKISWSASTSRRTLYEDLNGDLIVNYAGLPYDPPVERDESEWVVSYSRNQAVVPFWLLNYENAVNSDPFTVAGYPVAPLKAKISGLKIGDRETRENVSFYPVSLEIHLRAEGWRERRLNAGYEEYKDPANPNLGHKRITLSGDGTEPAHPWPLLVNGQALKDFTIQTPTVVEIKKYPELPYAQLGIT